MNPSERTRTLSEAAAGLEREGFHKAAAYLNDKATSAYMEDAQQGTHDEADDHLLALQSLQSTQPTHEV